MPPGPTKPDRGGPGAAKKGMAAKIGPGGKGKGKTILGGSQGGAKRHRKVVKDCIRGITKPAIRCEAAAFLVGEKGKISQSPLLHYKTASDGNEANSEVCSRLARRGGVKRISASIYDEARSAIAERIRQIIRDCVTFAEYRNVKTITVSHIIWALRRMNNPIYGFDPETYVDPKARK
nr:histone H4 [Colletotrichum truncatum]KAF6799807.1 histone H4 [Colletotrichum truncatum]